MIPSFNDIVCLRENLMNFWILQIREISFPLFKTLYISLFTARCFVFNQTTFKRQIVPTGDSSLSSPPMFDNSPLTRADCFQKCHYALGCQSVVVEGENCRLYTDTGYHGNDSFNLVSSLSYSNLNGNGGSQVQFSFISFGKVMKIHWPLTSSQYVLIRATLGLDFKLHCIIISKKMLKKEF